MSLEERVADGLSWDPFDHVFVVDSDAAFAEVRNIKRNESIADNSVLFEIDYRIPDPAAAILEAYPDIRMHDEYKFFVKTPEVEQRVRIGEDLPIIFKALDDLGVQSHVFFANPQMMSVAQCHSLTSLTVSMQNTSQINGTTLYLPGGDWWLNPDYRKDGCGGLAYARVTHLDAGLDSAAFNNAMASMISSMQNSSSINLHGPYFSGKSWLLSAIRLYKSELCGLSVYQSEDTASFMDRLTKVDVDNQLLYIDDIHRLDTSALQSIKGKYPRLICSSLERLPGFDKYVNTEGLPKK